MYSLKPNIEELKNSGLNPDCVRNVCILAHVDHGKTTIADSLLAINGLVSKRSAGHVRYLDDRLDEQERGITMKSSAVSLCFPLGESKYIVNLVDTPGHIDFSTEVAASVRICDGALIIVDLVEGVCVQTKDAIKQAYEEQVKMILVINKIDRCIVELHKSVDEIFQSILRVIEDCNVTIAELCTYDLELNEEDEEEFLFSPEKDNVILASAIDGWGVTTKIICDMFHDIIIDETSESLNEKIWNFDYYVDSTTKKVVTGCLEKKKENLFIQLCLKTIYYVYFTLMIRMERDKVNSILKKLKIKSPSKEMNHNDPRVQVKAILQSWSPLASVILNQCVNVIPSPSSINDRKIRHLVYGNRYFEDEAINNCCKKMMDGFKRIEDNTDAIVYVSKMFAVNKRNLSQNKPKLFIAPRSRNVGEIKQDQVKKEEIKNSKNETTEKDESCIKTLKNDQENVMIGLCRIFSGNLTIGQEIYFLSNCYIPIKENELDSDKIKKVTIKELYLLLGRELVLTNSVSFGNICAIGGIEDAVIRSGTLSSSSKCIPLTEYTYMEPIVRNTIEPVNPKDIQSLHLALKLLMQSDSCIQVVMQDTGEHVLVTAGDVHLAKCLEDLKSKFIKFDVNVSKPMVSLCETVISATRKVDLKDALEYVDVNVPEFGLEAQVRVVPLSEKIINFIKLNYDILLMIEEHQQQQNNVDKLASKQKIFQNEYTRNLVAKLKEQLNNVFQNSSGIWTNLSDKIWSISKTKNNINILFNITDDYHRNIFNIIDTTDERSNLDHCFVSGFEMCSRAGPICEEPLINCAFFVNKYILNSKNMTHGDLGVQVVANVTSAVKTGLREAFEKQQQRLMEPIFTTDIQVNTSILGKVYSVVNKRQGKVLQAIGMDDKEKTFMVTAQIPVIESDGFANEIRKTTSGQANPNLRFSHYEIIDGDPYYEEDVAAAEEDEDTVGIESAIRANRLMKEVRKRKGLMVVEQVVVHAEKQRTLNKKK